MFYNDGYVPILGVTKHPGWLGRSGRECWSEIWSIVGPMLDSVFVTGEATWSEDLLLVMRRNLSREENYFNSPTAPFATMMGRSGDFLRLLRDHGPRGGRTAAADASRPQPDGSRGKDGRQGMRSRGQDAC